MLLIRERYYSKQRRIALYDLRNTIRSLSNFLVKQFILAGTLFFYANNNLSANDTTTFIIENVSLHQENILTQEDDFIPDWAVSFVNRLHILTKEKVIRGELLFQVGDMVDYELIEETARNLRRLGIIGNIGVSVDTISDSTAGITVSTQDKWTQFIEFTYSQEGGNRNFSSRLTDNNIMGTATRLSGGYNYKSNRINNPHGSQGRFFNRRILGSKWGLSLLYKDAEEYSGFTAALDRPFYAEQSRWSAGVSHFNGLVKLQWYTIDVYKHDVQNLWYIRRFGKHNKYYGGQGLIRSRYALQDGTSSSRDYYTGADSYDMTTIYGGSINRRFYKDRFLNNFGRFEDVPVGYGFNSLLGLNFYQSSNSFKYFAMTEWQQALRITTQGYAAYRSAFGGFVQGEGFRDVTSLFEIIGHLKLPYRQTLVMRVLTINNYNWAPYRYIYLDTPSGLRGFEASKLRGQNRFLANVEDRIFSSLQLGIFRIGGVIFIDSGFLWKNKISQPEPPHTALGFGLRIENAKQQGHGITRIDFAFDANKKKFAEVIITSGHLFSAFTALSHMQPVRLHIY